jgi:sugar phosphate isomerase/epimerase
MANIKVGVLVDSLGLPAREGLTRAGGMGFSAVRLGARGQVDPRQLDRSGRRHLMKFVQGLGLSLSGWDGDPAGDAGRRLADPARVQEIVDRAKGVLELAAETASPVVTLRAGHIPGKEGDPAAAMVAEAVREIADHAERVGAVLALETADAPAERIGALVRSLGNPALKVSYDPGGLLLADRDPVASVEAVADHIIAVTARDVVGRRTGRGREVPLGRGELDYRELLGALAEAGYYGVHTLRRDPGPGAADELAEAKRFLEGL